MSTATEIKNACEHGNELEDCEEVHVPLSGNLDDRLDLQRSAIIDLQNRPSGSTGSSGGLSSKEQREIYARISALEDVVDKLSEK